MATITLNWGRKKVGVHMDLMDSMDGVHINDMDKQEIYKRRGKYAAMVAHGSILQRRDV